MSRDRLKKSYVKFCSADGNHHIASEFAILKLHELIDNFRIKSVLEVGLGIGAITGGLLSANKHLRYSGTEETLSVCMP
jgi:16S rRNA A1518/A1519 N6-dimethyltransferase RsmA/KsgA/DIM1 with predicted DNA glycosylase/AP lyase activity